MSESSKTAGAALAIMAAAALVVLAVVYGSISLYKGYWLFAQANANHQTKVIENGIGYQQAQVGVLNQQIANVEDLTTSMIGVTGTQLQADHAQRLGDARLACQAASQINTIPPDQRGWVHTNCLAGTLNPASPLEK